MCTLIAGVEVLGPRSLVLGANRDESPERASDGPGVLRERPRVVGGRDRVAGGTWLAVREAHTAIALMNRRPSAPAAAPMQGAPPALRSRGLLCLDVAASAPAPDAPHALDPETGERYPARLHAALAAIERDAYAACTLVGLSGEEPSWAILAEHGTKRQIRMLGPGWHVLTHADVDDRSEPRTAWLLERLQGADGDASRGIRPRSVAEAFDTLATLLRTHADGGSPDVCIHRERFPTVSSSLIALGATEPPRYLHAAGPPCVTPYADVSSLF